MRKFYVLTIGLFYLSKTLSENYRPRSDSVYVDYLTNDYLLTERDIWNDIATNTNLKDLLKKISSEHLNLFSNSFITSEPFNDQLLLNGKKFVDEQMVEVNLNMRVVKENYLNGYTNPESSKKQILEMAMQNSNTTLFDRLYDSVMREDVFAYIKSVI